MGADGGVQTNSRDILIGRLRRSSLERTFRGCLADLQGSRVGRVGRVGLGLGRPGNDNVAHVGFAREA